MDYICKIHYRHKWKILYFSYFTSLRIYIPVIIYIVLIQQDKDQIQYNRSNKKNNPLFLNKLPFISKWIIFLIVSSRRR